jgi:hypothetical protein
MTTQVGIADLDRDNLLTPAEIGYKRSALAGDAARNAWTLQAKTVLPACT